MRSRSGDRESHNRWCLGSGIRDDDGWSWGYLDSSSGCGCCGCGGSCRGSDHLGSDNPSSLSLGCACATELDIDYATILRGGGISGRANLNIDESSSLGGGGHSCSGYGSSVGVCAGRHSNLDVDEASSVCGWRGRDYHWCLYGGDWHWLLGFNWF